MYHCMFHLHSCHHSGKKGFTLFKKRGRLFRVKLPLPASTGSYPILIRCKTHEKGKHFWNRIKLMEWQSEFNSVHDVLSSVVTSDANCFESTDNTDVLHKSQGNDCGTRYRLYDWMNCQLFQTIRLLLNLVWRLEWPCQKCIYDIDIETQYHGCYASALLANIRFGIICKRHTKGILSLNEVWILHR